MARHAFSFNKDVSIKVHTHDNVPMTRYAELIEYLNSEKPLLMLSGEFVAYETDDSGWHPADKKYAVEPVVKVIIGKQDRKGVIMCRLEVDDVELMHALACAGMVGSLIESYELKADKSKKFFYLTFHEMN